MPPKSHFYFQSNLFRFYAYAKGWLTPSPGKIHISAHHPSLRFPLWPVFQLVVIELRMMHASIIASALLIFMPLFVHVQNSAAFAPAIHDACGAGRRPVPAVRQNQISNMKALYMSIEEGDSSSTSNDGGIEASPVSAMSETTSASSKADPSDESTSNVVPLDVPSPILLASSMVLAIASTGSIFELLGGSPQYGLAPTAAIAVIGTPLCFFLFYAAIVKGNAETEADDERFMENNQKRSSGFF